MSSLLELEFFAQRVKQLFHHDHETSEVFIAELTAKPLDGRPSELLLAALIAYTRHGVDPAEVARDVDKAMDALEVKYYASKPKKETV